MLRRVTTSVLILSLLLAVLHVHPAAAGWTWEGLVTAYGQRELHQRAAEGIRQDLLLDLPAGMDEKDLWEALWSEEEPRRRAALSLGLVDSLFPGADPGRWEEIQGFWRPSRIPRSLAALDGVFVAVRSLLEMGGEGTKHLALALLSDLSRSSRARYHALLHAPREYREILERLGRVTPPLPFDVLTGTLPLARPVRGWISQEAAMMRGVTFLDSFGGVAQGGGAYAWDRARGRIYRVRDGEDRLRWLIFD